ncbi:unnamed protein product [Amoebophrya sp. A120]|nr:unnamed protein product [Amoebophrya sp. A120]|eukprot:GSA120T00017719001.1
MDWQDEIGRRVLRWQTPGGLFSRLKARRSSGGSPLLARQQPVRCDYPLPWRFDWGGHDPACPMMEMVITMHNSMYAMFTGIVFWVCWIFFRPRHKCLNFGR